MSLLGKWRSPGFELFVLSAASLYLELLIIRWMSGDINAFSIFKTFPLVTCYIGLGIGCAVGNNRHFKLLPVALLIFAVILKVPDLLKISDMFTFPSRDGFTPWSTAGGMWAYMLLFAPLLLLLLSAPFAVMACVGSRLGTLFNELKALPAYSINVGGAIAGSLVFTLLSFSGWFPWQMLVPALIVLLPYLLGEKKSDRWLMPLSLTASVALAAWEVPVDYAQSTISYGVDSKQSLPKPDHLTIWSPYQRLDVVTQRFVTTVGGKELVVPLGVNVFSNRRGYQDAIDLRPSQFEKYNSPMLMQAVEEYGRRYHLPFEVRPAGDTLIVGAGSGTDVAEGLACGAAHIDAVDIDPSIIEVGRRFNPAHPYDDPRVTVFCDDARHYFNGCQKKYDTIVFSHLDSLASIGQGGSVRVDNYVYTIQSFQKALSLLKPNGLLTVSFCTRKDWFRDRLFNTLKAAVGYPPLLVNDLRSKWLVANTFFFAGEPVKNGQISLPQEEKSAFKTDPNFIPTNARVLTDDWPYLYNVPDPIDWPYMCVVFEVIVVALFAGRKVIFGTSTPRDWQLFFMGAAFLLLELQSISRLSLLYGSSWFTSAVVINTVLVMILAANAVINSFHGKAVNALKFQYLGLFCLLLISYSLPLRAILEIGAVGYALVTLITSLPIFMAGLIFASSFESTGNSRRALAFNLLGAVVGSLLEYLSTYLGVNGLIAVAGILYACSLVFALKEGKSQTIVSPT